MAVGLAVSLSRAGVAQDEPPPQKAVSLGVLGGVSIPAHVSSDVLDIGWNVTGEFLLNLDRLTALRVDLSYEHFGFVTSGRFESGSAHTFGGTAGLRLNLLEGGRVKPYLVVGLGAFNLTTDGVTRGGANLSSNATGFGFDAGLGLSVALKRVELHFVTTLLNIFVSESPIPSDNVYIVPIAVGVMF